jgi:hypothetical protein
LGDVLDQALVDDFTASLSPDGLQKDAEDSWANFGMPLHVVLK